MLYAELFLGPDFWKYLKWLQSKAWFKTKGLVSDMIGKSPKQSHLASRCVLAKDYEKLFPSSKFYSSITASRNNGWPRQSKQTHQNIWFLSI